MIFHDLSPDQSVGAILAHSLTLGDRTLKKGTVLEAATVQLLIESGINQISVAQLEADDVPENEAAATVAQAASGPLTRTDTSFTGRANIFSETDGIVLLNPERIQTLNSVDEAMTLATLPPYARVRAGQILATIKLIPFACARTIVEATQHIAHHPTPLITVKPFRSRHVALISTTHDEGQNNTKPQEKLSTITKNRLTPLGGHLTRQDNIPHNKAAVAEAIFQAVQNGYTLILIAGASAITDRQDVIPLGIKEAGGEIVHFGMPVDPGNLLLLARHQACAIIGLPGCARSPKLNGFDWVLERLMADIDISPTDIMAMGAGGLLKEIPSRPQPRHRPKPTPHAPIAALVLAAGQSRRMGTTNKLLSSVRKLPQTTPMVRLVAEAALASQAHPVVVVTGHDAPAITKALEGLAVTFIHNPDYQQGLSTSLVAGLQALPQKAAGVLVCLGDMPLITPAHLDHLISQFNPVDGRTICVPTVRGRRGNPVLWGAQFWPEILSLTGDQGARTMLNIHEDEVWEVPFEDDAPLTDIDTEERLQSLSQDITRNP